MHGPACAEAGEPMSDLAGPGTGFKDNWRIASARDEIESLLQQIMVLLGGHGWDETSIFAVRLALEEGLSNAMRHGNSGDPHRLIQLELSGDYDGLLAAIEDEGPGYDPASVPDPTADENLTVASGRGLALIRAFMTEVTVVEPGNRLEIRYARPAT